MVVKSSKKCDKGDTVCEKERDDSRKRFGIIFAVFILFFLCSSSFASLFAIIMVMIGKGGGNSSNDGQNNASTEGSGNDGPGEQ